MLGDSIHINNFNWNPAVLKKNLLAKTSVQITIFWPNLCQNGVRMDHTQNKNRFFSEIELEHKLSKIFYFLKILYVLAEL